ncbi:MAG: ABC transporter permease, partial [Bacteroidales bacterium]
ISFRILFKNRLFTLMTILNLTIGFSACLLLLKYVRFELSFDKFYPESEQVYRISYERSQNGIQEFHSARTMSALAPAILRDFPEVTNAIRGCYEECLIYRKEQQKFMNKQKVLWADDGFLDIFRIGLIQGDPETALVEPYSAIISETQANKLFGEEDAIGQSFWHNEGLVFKVTGIFREIPQNTHLDLDFIYSYCTFEDWPFGVPEGNWSGNWLYTYIRTGEDFDPDRFEAALNQRVQTYMPDLESRNTEVKFHLQPLEEIYLHSNLDNEVKVNGDRRTVIILLIVSMIILLIAWINYINLLVAQNHEREHEFGTRKVLGEGRRKLFLETTIIVVLMNGFTLGLSILVVRIINTGFNRLFDLSVEAISFNNNLFWLAVAGVMLAGMLLSGIYPSLVSARAETAHVASSSHKTVKGKLDFRKLLVVIQFTLSTILIFNALLLTRQVNYMLSGNLGFNPEEVIVLNAPETWCQTPDSIKSGYIDHLRNLLIQYPEIEYVSGCNFVPGAETMRYLDNLSAQNIENSKEHNSIFLNSIDYRYFDVLDIKFLAGRNFFRDNSMDRNCLILNETAVSQLGFKNPEAAINQIVTNGQSEFRIIGVVKDHHHLGLRNGIKPMGFMHRYFYDFGFLLIKVNGDHENAIRLVEKHWKEEFPLALFDYQYLFDFFNQQYKPELRIKKSIAFFSLVALVLACVGLFGLMKYSLTRRLKELSIKRVLGASVSELMVRLSLEFLVIVLMALVIAFICSWWIASMWMQNFPIRTNINLWAFVLSAGIILIASAITLVWHVHRAANQNPINGLREE